MTDFTWWQAIFLGILQGITEFLPISSSGHLVLVPWLFGWDVSNLTFDTTVHLGTLLAVVIYFWRDFWAIFLGWLNTLKTRSLADTDGRVGWFIILGTIPAAVIGYLFEDFFESLFGTPLLVSVLLLVTGFILFFTERMSSRSRDLDSMTWRDSLLIGLAQAGAIAPGISRSGATIAAGLAFNLKREVATRYSFLLGTPIILGAGIFKLKDVFEIGITSSELTILAIGFVTAAVSGFASIYWMLAYVRRHSLAVFYMYCWAFGIFSLVIALVRG